jgi:S-adenosylmethionine decarboxylase
MLFQELNPPMYNAKHMNFGEHLMIDGYNGNREKLNDKKLVMDCLNGLPDLLGMRKLSSPEIYFAEGNNLKDPGGWSGFVVIQESHISVHTFPGRRFVSADVYTCKNGMDVDFILDYFRKKFDLQDIETNFAKRGTRYPSGTITLE